MVGEWQRSAAECAVCYVQSGMVVGLGSGRTAAYAVRRIAQLLRAERLQGIRGIPTSRAVEALAQAQGIPLTSLEEHPVVDVTIDGADEVDPDLNLIKGLGGAMLYEKIVARVSRSEIIVIDESKLVPRLGTQVPVPVEVIPFGWPAVARMLAEMGGEPARRMHAGDPVLTDEGNYILDCHFGRIDDAKQLDCALRMIPGVVEHGLFVGLTSMVVVAGREGLSLRYPRATGYTSDRDGTHGQ